MTYPSSDLNGQAGELEPANSPEILVPKKNVKEGEMIYIENVSADKLREQLAIHKPEDVISVVVSRYQDGWAIFYQIICKDKRTK